MKSHEHGISGMTSSPDDPTTYYLEFTVNTPFARYTTSNREKAKRWINLSGCTIADWSIHREFQDGDFLEVSIYEWKGEPLTGADPAQIGAFRPKRFSTHFFLHPEAFAEVWAASEAGNRATLRMTLELKRIDPDLYAVVDVTFVR
jgi:hypothetical protein